MDIGTLLHMPEADAIALCLHSGFITRITRQDDHYFVVTRDFKDNRVNLEIDGGIVTRASIG